MTVSNINFANGKNTVLVSIDISILLFTSGIFLHGFVSEIPDQPVGFVSWFVSTFDMASFQKFQRRFNHIKLPTCLASSNPHFPPTSPVKPTIFSSFLVKLTTFHTFPLYPLVICYIAGPWPISFVDVCWFTGWWFQPLWKIWTSMGRIIPYMKWKIKVMFETTNQLL